MNLSSNFLFAGVSVLLSRAVGRYRPQELPFHPAERADKENHSPKEEWFQGLDIARVQSPEDIAERLASCEKIQSSRVRTPSDSLRNLAIRLEREGRGNCKAHAAWTFCQLAALKFDPEFFIGRWKVRNPHSNEFHSWVQFERSGKEWIVEGMENRTDRVLRHLDEVRHHYSPRYSITASGRTFTYK